jgi:hypothetical protein
MCIGISKDDMMEILAEHDKMKETKTLSMTGASAGDVRRLLLNLELFVEDADALAASPDVTPIAEYDWKDRREDDSEAFAGAYAFLNKLLIDSGVQFGDRGFQLVDVHSLRTILNFEDEKLGKLSGGTDIIIIPNKLSRIS